MSGISPVVSNKAAAAEAFRAALGHLAPTLQLRHDMRLTLCMYKDIPHTFTETQPSEIFFNCFLLHLSSFQMLLLLEGFAHKWFVLEDVSFRNRAFVVVTGKARQCWTHGDRDPVGSQAG